MINIRLFIMFLTTILLKFTFDSIYVNYIYPYFAYETFTMQYSPNKQVVSYLLVLITVILLYFFEKDNRSIKIPYFFLFFSLVLPFSTIYVFEAMDIKYFLSVYFCFNLILFLSIVTPDFKIKWPEKNILIIPFSIMFIIYFYTYIMLLLNGGFSRINFNLNEVYETRELLSENSFFLSSYVISWIGYSFNPLLIVVGLYNKNKKLFFIGLILQIILFGMTNFKSFLFSIPLILLVYYVSRMKFHYNIICVGITVLMIFLYFSFIYSGNITLSSILVRRQFFVPAHLHYLYNDFFTRNPLIYLSDSIFKYFTTYPYNDGVTRIIGMEYWGKKFGPNVGFFGNAFYNFGYLGILTFSLLLFIFTKLIVSFESKVPKYLICSIILVPFMALINSGFLTTLLTHSLLISVLNIWFIGSIIKQEEA